MQIGVPFSEDEMFTYFFSMEEWKERSRWSEIIVLCNQLDAESNIWFQSKEWLLLLMISPFESR